MTNNLYVRPSANVLGVIKNAFLMAANAKTAATAIFARVADGVQKIWPTELGILVHGTAASISATTADAVAGHNDNYALIAGLGTTLNGVDAYNARKEKSAAPNLTTGRSSAGNGYVNGNCIFAGGLSGSTLYAVVNAYDNALEVSILPALDATLHGPACADTKDYAVFAGGNSSSSGGTRNLVTAYDANLEKIVPPVLTTARRSATGASVNNCVLVAGGLNSGGSTLSSVEAYDENLEKLASLTALSRDRTPASTQNNNYAIFAGGTGGSASRNNVEAYDKNLEQVIPATLISTRSYAGGYQIGRFALLCGGGAFNSTTNLSNICETYDENLELVVQEPLSVARRCYRRVTTLKNILFVFGGYGGASAVVDTYDYK